MLTTTIIERTSIAATNVGALNRWMEIDQTYNVYTKRDIFVENTEKKCPEVLPSGSHVASYSWCNYPCGVLGANETSFLMAPHFCCDDGLALVKELAERWEHINVLKEGVRTGLDDAIVTGSASMLFTALVSSVACGVGGSTYGMLFGFSAGLSKGVFYAVKQAAVSGFWGGANGAVRGMFWGGNFVSGVFFGAAGGLIGGVRQYYSLQTMKEMEDLLIASVKLFSEFSTGECKYNKAIGRLAVLKYKIQELIPDEGQRSALPICRAFLEVNVVLENYARTKGWSD